MLILDAIKKNLKKVNEAGVPPSFLGGDPAVREALQEVNKRDTIVKQVCAPLKNV